MANEFPCAGITVTVTKFESAPRIESFQTTKYSDADVLLIGKATGKVSQAGGKNTPIRVDQFARVDLMFVVESATANGHHFNPVGISFFASDGDLGMDDFPTRTVTADPFGRLVMVVHDANIHGATYKFNLVIQEVETGLLGVIDPQIHNA